VTAPCNEIERDLLACLRRSGRSVSAAELGAVLHCDPRRARSLVNHVRSFHRAPICSTPSDGYWFARSAADIERAVAQMRSRVVEIEAAARGLELAGEEYFGDPATGQMALVGL
jgi:hypothetical protein